MSDLQRLARATQPVSERRRGRRTEVGLKAEVIVSETVKIQTSLANLTPHGCQLVAGRIDARRGQFIVLRIDGVGRINGLVRWIAADGVGIEFTRAIDQGMIPGDNPTIENCII